MKAAAESGKRQGGACVAANKRAWVVHCRATTLTRAESKIHTSCLSIYLTYSQPCKHIARRRCSVTPRLHSTPRSNTLTHSPRTSYASRVELCVFRATANSSPPSAASPRHTLHGATCSSSHPLTQRPKPRPQQLGAQLRSQPHKHIHPTYPPLTYPHTTPPQCLGAQHSTTAPPHHHTWRWEGRWAAPRSSPTATARVSVQQRECVCVWV